MYDDRRRLSGDPIDDHARAARAAERILAQYTPIRGSARLPSGVSDCSFLESLGR